MSYLFIMCSLLFGLLALSPKEIQDFFIPIVKLAEHLLKIHETKKQEIYEPPVVTVRDVIKVAYIHM